MLEVEIINAIEKGNYEQVEELLDRGANVEATMNDSRPPNMNWYGGRTVKWRREGQGRTALQLAALNGHKDIAELLITNGAEVDAVDEGDITALIVAAHRQQTELVELLLKNGADPNVIWDSHHLLARIASGNWKDETAVQILESLIRHGANLEATDHFSQTALTWACRVGNHCRASALLRAGANPNHVAKRENTALTSTLFCFLERFIDKPKFRATTEVLLSHGADPNLGFTPLMLVCQTGRSKIVKHVLKYSNNINKPWEDGRTAFHIAALNGFVSVVKLLMNLGADITRQDHDGKTALELAEIREPDSRLNSWGIHVKHDFNATISLLREQL